MAVDILTKLGINKTTFEQALGDYDKVRALVRRHEGVILPENIKALWDSREEHGVGLIGLDYGLDMPIPITGFKVTEEGIYATLSFDRVPYPTFVPWDAIVALAGLDMHSNPAPPPAKARPKLKLV
jgi:hypothetical protein